MSLRANTTPHLIADIERLREHFGVDRWLLLGGSWGSTLALAYAEAHPEHVSELVLFAVVLGLHSEFDRVFRGGLAAQFPTQWRRLREAVTGPRGKDEEVARATHERLWDPDPAVRARAAYEWCLWETAILDRPSSDGGASPTLHPRARDPDYALAFTRIATHYVIHNAWLEDGVILDRAGTLASIPMVLINGRDDPQAGSLATELAERLPRARSIFIDNAGHSARHPDFAAAIVGATDAFAT